MVLKSKHTKPGIINHIIGYKLKNILESFHNFIMMAFISLNLKTFDTKSQYDIKYWLKNSL